MAASPTAGIMTPRGLAFYEEGSGYVVPGADYWDVQMGPDPEWAVTPWKAELYSQASAMFPDEEKGRLYALRHKARYPHRQVEIVHPDGTREEIEFDPSYLQLWQGVPA